MAELGFRVRFAVNNHFVVKLALDLAVEYLQFLVRYAFQVLRERVCRGKVQLFIQVSPPISCWEWLVQCSGAGVKDSPFSAPD